MVHQIAETDAVEARPQGADLDHRFPPVAALHDPDGQIVRDLARRFGIAFVEKRLCLLERQSKMLVRSQ